MSTEKRKKQTIFGEVSPEQHRKWAEHVWSRMDRDGSGEITIDELNCEEFMQILRNIFSPLTAGKGVASYARSEINATQCLSFLLKAADKDGNGVLDFEEFEHFLRGLRKHRSSKAFTDITFALFDVDQSGFIEEGEFRDIWRYFNGHNPTAVDFTHHWSYMDEARTGRVTKASYAKWLAKKAPLAFRVHALPVFGDEDSVASEVSSVDVGGHKKAGLQVFRPSPGMWHEPPKAWSTSVEWNPRFANKCPSEQNEAWRGCQRKKTMFSRPESLPDLRKFYRTHVGFSAHRKRMASQEPFCPKPVLSHESVQSVKMPGLDRHMQIIRNRQGDLLEWKQNTPRALQKRLWEPGSLLLRVPVPPAPFLVQGRDAPPAIP